MPSRLIHHGVEFAYTFCGPRWRCAYCDDIADTIDHTVPRCFVRGNWRFIARYRLVKLQCCRQCNALAAGIIDETFIQRRRRIARGVRKRSKLLLQTASWADDEIDELGPMRAHILSATEAADETRRRLRMLDSPVPPDGVPNLLWAEADDMPPLNGLLWHDPHGLIMEAWNPDHIG